MKTLKEFVWRSERFIAAHRGSSGNRPENTMAAFEEAVKTGAAMIEIDVQITRDHRIVVHHDDELGRTTNGKGILEDMSYRELSGIDAGSWYDPIYYREKIPLLEDVISLIRDKAYLGIEIKPMRDHKFEQRLDSLLNLLTKCGYEKNSFLASFDYRALKFIKKVMPEFHTAAIKLPDDYRLPSEIAEDADIEAIICDVSELSKPFETDALKNRIVTGVYSIDNEEDLETVSKYKINAYATNSPERLAEMLDKFDIRYSTVK